MATIRNKSHFNFRTPRHLIIARVACRPPKIRKRGARNVNSTRKSCERDVDPADNQSFLFGGEDLQFAICTPRSRARVGIRGTCLSIIGVIDMGEPR